MMVCMRYEQSKELTDEIFKQVTGVERKTFEEMAEILQEAEYEQKAKGGRPNKNSIEDRLLMTLQYLCEYRSYIHIAVDFGIGKSNVYETVKWVENTLVKSGKYKLSVESR